MGKKTQTEQLKNKKSKTKYKEMFPELATHQEEVVKKKQEINKYETKRVIYQNSQSQVQLEVLEHHNKNLDLICQTVNRLLSKNKVSAKNAFDVPFIDLEDLPDFLQSFENQFAWKRLSSTLQNDYKIYGYRVDAIHSITYNILHTMARRQQQIDLVHNSTQPQNIIEQQQGHIKISEGSQNQHIQRKLENLDLTALQLALGVDPILERNKRKFDQLGNNSMLLDTLPIDDFLALQLAKSSDIHKTYPPWGQYNGPWKLDDPIMAFCQLNNFRAKLQEDFEGKMKDQNLYQMLLEQKQNHFSGNYLNTKMEAQHIKSMFKQHKLKNIYLRDENDLMDDAKIWMQTQNRLMNMKKVPQKIDNSLKYEIKIQDPANRIDFDFAINSRQEIFKKQNEKMQFHQQIQDRFLLANKLPYSFDIINYPLTLKQNPALPKTDIKVEAQVDVRRQMVSILQAKRRMKNLIHQRSTFKAVYQNYSVSEDISPALCFLTILHLANQNNLSLQQLDESNFYVH